MDKVFIRLIYTMKQNTENLVVLKTFRLDKSNIENMTDICLVDLIYSLLASRKQTKEIHFE